MKKKSDEVIKNVTYKNFVPTKPEDKVEYLNNIVSDFCNAHFHIASLLSYAEDEPKQFDLISGSASYIDIMGTIESDLGKLIIDKFNTTKISPTLPIFTKDNINKAM